MQVGIIKHRAADILKVFFDIKSFSEQVDLFADNFLDAMPGHRKTILSKKLLWLLIDNQVLKYYGMSFDIY